MASLKKIALGLLAAGAALSATGCTAPMSGNPSLSLISNSLTEKQYKPVGGEVVKEACMSVIPIPFIMWGESRSHEKVVQDILDEYKADVLLNTEMSYDFLWLLFYAEDCVTVKGTPAIRTAPGEGGFDNNSGSKWMEGK